MKQHSRSFIILISLFVTTTVNVWSAELDSTNTKQAQNIEQKSSKEKKKEEIKQHIKEHYKFYGFIRNYFTLDTRESKAATFDSFYYLPKDINMNEDGSQDLNQQTSFRYLALTSRIGVDVQSYKYKSTTFGAKIEADFYCTNSGGNVATLRLRHAYATMSWDDLPISRDKKAKVSLLMGQNWHPISVGQPDDFSFENGAPFNAYNRSPQITMEATFDKRFTLTASLLYQMQYTSTGPNGTSGDYIKYGCTPESYMGLTYKNKGFMARVGVDILSIKPRHTGLNSDSITVKVSDRITTFTPYLYLEYKYKDLALRGKTVYSSAGEHFYMMSGYAVTNKYDDGHYEYTPLHCSSSWISILYGKELQGGLFLGYIENLGTNKSIYSEKDLYFNGSGFANINRMYRIIPSIRYNIWKFTIGLEYHFTSVQYGDKKLGIDLEDGLYKEGLHWVSNHRAEMMLKFSF